MTNGEREGAVGPSGRDEPAAGPWNVGDERSNSLGLLVGILGVVIVGYFVVHQFVVGYTSTAIFALSLVALAGWLCSALWRRPAVGVMLPAAAAMILPAALAAAPSDGALIVPAAVGVMRLLTDLRLRVWFGAVAALLAGLLVVIGAIGTDISPTGLLSLEGGIVLGVLGGANRRQAHQAARRQRALVQSTITAREEHARASALQARQSAARDIHDVLAHSLGGLVIQLDAVEALLESGRVDEAATRVTDARALAASGLADARRAVETLREPSRRAGAVAGEEIARTLHDLVDAHRGLGFALEFTETGSPVALDADAAAALRRALQEALSNVRRHAPGQPAGVRVDWGAERVTLQVRNPLPARRASDDVPSGPAVGGGHGLRGMRERFAELGGSSASAGVREDDFVVQVELEVR
ncbi:histidine kinase [Microbacterium sp. STN6]|uniref:sensor histidine kinase n=1 Tax=Microbacterium sp. STN6 TaxID=2995588 RepID=UPI002260D65C|nr:histidine kinase [Microbacterium sp. STN6]MCX7523166.1 histidine kinase [Microbacterium sp. STN6]